MYGQFGGMQQSMQKLSQEIRVKDTAFKTMREVWSKCENAGYRVCL